MSEEEDIPGLNEMSAEQLRYAIRAQKIALVQQDNERRELKAENQRLKETLDTLTKEVAAAYMKAIGPVEPAGGERE